MQYNVELFLCDKWENSCRKLNNKRRVFLLRLYVFILNSHYYYFSGNVVKCLQKEIYGEITGMT